MPVSTRSAAPGPLELVRAFVNTLDVEAGADALADPPALRAWLAERDLLEPADRVGPADLRRARELREALRRLLVANAEGTDDPPARAALDAAARAARLELRFTPGAARMEPGRDGATGALGHLVAIVAEAVAAGTWPRLKACRSGSCRWAFYDGSKNRSRSWCSMAVCGNRSKARAFRRRHGP